MVSRVDLGKMTPSDFRFLTKDGQLRWAHFSNKAIYNEGRFVGLQGLLFDITESKKMEEEAGKRLQELEVFYKASIGREERIIELKKEIEMLKKELGTIRKTL